MLIEKPLDKNGNRDWYTSVEPTIEPITLTELKLFAKIDYSYEDDLLEGFITTIREAMEQYLGRSLIERTIVMEMDFWPSEKVTFPMPPLISVTSVETIDEDDTATTYSSDSYYVNTNRTPGELIIKNSVTPPFNEDRYYSGYRITYKAGYGTATTDVPQLIRDGIKMWITEFHENRITDDLPPQKVRNLVRLYKIRNI